MKQGKRRCAPEYDLPLSCFFGITPGMWMNLQLDYEFMCADREKGETIRKEVQPCAALNLAHLKMRELTLHNQPASTNSLLDIS